MSTDQNLIQPIRGSAGANIVGPRNPAIEGQNESSLVPPVTDSGSIPQIKFSFSQAHIRISDGGWAREVTQRELPISKSMAGVNMRLGPGVIRELHWHKEAEWAYILQGRARITIIDPEGRTFVDDVSEGDVWLFPAGFPHSIQGLEEGTEFILVFSDGDFSENETMLITEWFAHTPREVLSKNFGLPQEAFNDIPPHEKYIFRAPVPGPIEEVLREIPYEQVPSPYTFHASEVVHTSYDGGTTLVMDDRNFPVTELAAVITTLDAGAMREMHWHPKADEWLYVVKGHLRVTVFDSVKNARTWDFFPGDVGYIPRTFGHYIENRGSEPARLFNVFSHPRFEDISLNQWLALTPPELVKTHLNLGDDFIHALVPARRKIVK